MNGSYALRGWIIACLDVVVAGSDPVLPAWFWFTMAVCYALTALVETILWVRS